MIGHIVIIENGMLIEVVLIDLRNLENYGVDPDNLNWFTSYLTRIEKKNVK